MESDDQIRVIDDMGMDIDFHELSEKIQTSKKEDVILSAARKTLEKARNLWQPRAVARWLDIQSNPHGSNGPDWPNGSIGPNGKSGPVGLKGPGGSNGSGQVIIRTGSREVMFDMGFSGQFVTGAGRVLVGVYTAGPELEQAAADASAAGDLLESYMLDLIGLIVLNKTGRKIKQIAEQEAAKMGWGAGPFLSPGSVHGWELTDQIKLCSLLPLEKIKVGIGTDAVLRPFKSISCLIGIGSGYDNSEVGSACQVCTKKENCQMRENQLREDHI